MPIGKKASLYRLRELYEADFHKFGIYGSVRVWANAWDVFRRTPSRGGRGRRAAVDFVVCFWVRRDSFCVCIFFPRFFFFFERTRPAASMRPRCLIYLCTSNEARARERSNRAVFRLQAEKPLHTGVRTGCHYLISLCVCQCVSV